MEYLSEVGDWEAFIDVLGLSLFGIVLLPRLDNYVDRAAIDAFWACRENNKNPMISVLANTYYTLNNSRERKGGRMTCYLYILYLWIITHMFTSTCKTPCPIEDHKWCFVKTVIDQDLEKHLQQDYSLVPHMEQKGGRPKCHNASINYKSWLKSQLDIELPFGQILLIVEKDPIPGLCSDEVTQLKEILAEVEEEKRDLKRKLIKAHEETEREKKISKLRQKRAK
ncbi:hypothetical protein CR513_55877, partial [Mucuna pruriens]